MEVTAAEAFPDRFLRTREYPADGDVFRQFPEYLLVVPFGDTDGVEGLGARVIPSSRAISAKSRYMVPWT